MQSKSKQQTRHGDEGRAAMRKMEGQQKQRWKDCRKLEEDGRTAKNWRKSSELSARLHEDLWGAMLSETAEEQWAQRWTNKEQWAAAQVFMNTKSSEQQRKASWTADHRFTNVLTSTSEEEGNCRKLEAQRRWKDCRTESSKLEDWGRWRWKDSGLKREEWRWGKIANPSCCVSHSPLGLVSLLC